MDHWNDQYHNISNKSILNEASHGSFNLPDTVSHQGMTGSAHGALSGSTNSINIGTFQSVNQLAPGLLNQHLFQPCNLLSTHHKLEHIQSNLIANNEHQNAYLVPSDISCGEVNNICKPWNTPTSIYKSSTHNSKESASQICISNEMTKLQKEPPPAHTSNRPNAQNNCRSASLTIKSFGLPITSEVQQDQFSVRNFTLSTTSICSGDAQKTSASGNTGLQNLLSQQVYIEGFNSPTNTKVMSDMSTIRLNQPLQYITVQPASAGYANSIVFLDKNHFVGNQKIVQPQIVKSALYQNLHQTQGINIPVYQYSQLQEQHLPVLSQSSLVEPSSNFMDINSKISDCRSVNGNSYLNAIAGSQSQAIAQMSMSSEEAVQAVADSTTKPKRGTRGGSKSNRSNSNPKIMLDDDSLDKRKLKERRFVSYTRDESDLEQQVKVYQNQSNELVGLSSNEMIFERNVIAPTTSSLCSFDPNVFTQTFDSGNLTNIEQGSLSCATNLLSPHLMNFSYNKPSANEHGRNDQVFLTNVFGNSFVNLNVINKETNTLVSAEQIRTGKEVAFSVDNVSGKKVPLLQMRHHLDDEFSHLVKDPVPSFGPKVTFQPRPNKRTFVDCFIDFLQGKRQETLSSLTNVPITKKPDLPKYIPDIRSLRKGSESESNSSKHLSNSNNNSSIHTTFESTCVMKTLEDPQLINLNVSKCLKAKRGRKLKQKQIVKRDKKRKVDAKFKGDISDGNSTDVMGASYNDGYDSGSDPLWCPEKAIIKNGSSANEKYFPKRRKLKKTLDDMSTRNQLECAIPVTKKIASLTTRYQKGDFLIDKKDLQALGSTSYNIWRVDSNRLLQKYEPLSSNNEILHLPTSVYSSWSENMVENYSLLKVQPSVPRAKTIKVVDVIKEHASHNDSHLQIQMNDQQCLSSCSSSSIQTSLHHNAGHLFQELNRQQLQSEVNNYIRKLLKQHLCSTYTSHQFLDNDVARHVQIININELLKSCKDRIRGSVQWRPEFYVEVEQHSLMTINDSQIRELTCQVSGTGIAEKVVKLHGEKYHPESLHVIQVVDEICAREFHINVKIMDKVQAYHRVHALKFQWLSQCIMKVKELKEMDIAGNLLLEDPLKDESWMSLMTNNFIQTLKDSWEVL